MEEEYEFVRCSRCGNWSLIVKTRCVVKGCQKKRYKNNLICKRHFKEMKVKNNEKDVNKND